jgi:uncharacterized protein
MGDITWWSLGFIICFAFAAGFVDAIVGGGGLIQLPALLIQLPDKPLPTLLGTGKIAGFTGTSIAAVSYSRRITFDYRLLIVMTVVAFMAAYFGSLTLTYLDPNFLRPMVLVVLIVIAIYTFFKKELGQEIKRDVSTSRMIMYSVLICLLVGFYDGFFGPGTGSFFVLGFVALLGLDFLHASAYAKIINGMTNIGSLSLMISKGMYILPLALCMAVANGTGSFIGSRYALRKGNGYVRKIFMIVVVIMIIRYAYDIITK